MTDPTNVYGPKIQVGEVVSKGVELSGKWFFLATNEPTIPSFCICGYNNFTIEHDVKKYEYATNLTCRGSPFTIHIKGNLSSDPTSPGNLVENAEIYGHNIAPLVPNMVFKVDRGDDGEISRIYTYACVGKILGHELFDHGFRFRLGLFNHGFRLRGTGVDFAMGFSQLGEDAGLG